MQSFLNILHWLFLVVLRPLVNFFTSIHRFLPLLIVLTSYFWNFKSYLQNTKVFNNFFHNLLMSLVVLVIWKTDEYTSVSSWFGSKKPACDTARIPLTPLGWQLPIVHFPPRAGPHVIWHSHPTPLRVVKGMPHSLCQ